MKRFWKPAGLVVVAMLAVLFVFALVTTEMFTSLGDISPGPRTSPQFRDGRFRNTQEVTADVKKPLDTLREWLANDAETIPRLPLPLYSSTEKDLAAPPESGLRITWFGHSSTLIELDGARILTDPQWSERCSPSMLVGPKRFHPPVIPLAKLGRIDAVTISHDHYDHLDMATVKELAATGTRFLVALGVGAHLRKWGVPEAQVIEHDWWMTTDIIPGVRAVSTPAQHFSGRFVMQGSTLWTSWSFVGPTHRVFHSGDTGSGPHLEQIGAKLGPFDVVMLEIGQYHPSWGTIHLGPLGALDAHRALKGQRLFPIHWSTFELGLHAWNEPPETLVQNAGEIDVVTPMLGQPVEPTRPAERTRWWRSVTR